MALNIRVIVVKNKFNNNLRFSIYLEYIIAQMLYNLVWFRSGSEIGPINNIGYLIMNM